MMRNFRRRCATLLTLLSLVVVFCLSGYPSSAAVTGLGLGDKSFNFAISGHNRNRAAYNTLNLEEQIHKAAELGVSMYRFDAYLDDLKSIAFTDDVVYLCKAYGLDLMLIVYSPSSAKTAVQRYKGKVKYYQVDNEMDGATINPSGPDGKLVSDFDKAKMDVKVKNCISIINTLRAGDPAAKILVNGTWVHYGCFQYLFDQGVDVDLLGWDWYRNQDTYGFEKAMDELYSQFHKDILICEANIWCKTDDQALMADYLTQRAQLVYSIAKAKHIVGFTVYELLNEPALNDSPGESDFGLVNVNRDQTIGSVKPAYTALQTLYGGKSLPVIHILPDPPVSSTPVPPPQPPASSKTTVSSGRNNGNTPAGSNAASQGANPSNSISSLDSSAISSSGLTASSSSDSSSSVTVSQPKPSSPIVWILLVVALVIILGGGGTLAYVLIRRRKQQQQQ